MDEVLFFILGVLIICLGVYDLLYTTFAPRGAGLMSGLTSTLIWRFFLGLSMLFKTRRALAGAGITIIMATILSWVLMLWAGQTLIYLSDVDAVVNSTTEVPANLYDRIYFTGYTLSSLGNGDFKGGTNAWRVYSAFISFSGLIFITIAISYMVPILSAVTERRSLSIRIAAIGDSPELMLLNSWDGKDFKSLDKHFSGLAQPIAKQGQLHLAYPLLHYFYHSEKAVALLPNLAALDEALTMLLLYVPEDKRPSNQTMVPIRRAITTFMESLTAITPAPKSLEEPYLGIKQLEEANIPLQLPEAERLDQLRKRRKLLNAMLSYVGWEWEEIANPKFNTDLDLRDIR
ncbi:potassium channel family protein [Pontibacter mangrovi]|uniref:Two pore domain potassium channel family protein n=1 Tax=Pontibacter mangrovi TaxID=2589816 RepID=A0A501WBH0_9BACT|nr:potassium channel family protein [Pontibacter mangrovi]TPE45865.1 two pore domain potassium channel family protein [Pontibacter mangrovi]